MRPKGRKKDAQTERVREASLDKVRLAFPEESVEIGGGPFGEFSDLPEGVEPLRLPEPVRVPVKMPDDPAVLQRGADGMLKVFYDLKVGRADSSEFSPSELAYRLDQSRHGKKSGDCPEHVRGLILDKARCHAQAHRDAGERVSILAVAKLVAAELKGGFYPRSVRRVREILAEDRS